MGLILVRGVNEFGSAIACRLYQAGYDVVLHDVPDPADCHRGMAFTDAVYDGSSTLDGVTACRIDRVASIRDELAARAAIPITTAELAAILGALNPAVLVDARMRKRHQPEGQIDLAPLTIGVGPNFIAGETTDLIVETGFGGDFAEVRDRGRTRPLAGEPPPVLGHGRDRFIYATAGGTFRTDRQIGQAVRRDEVIAHAGTTPLLAPIDGALRGLTRDGATVAPGVRVIEVDPRGPAAMSAGIGPRQSRIAEAVLTAIRQHDRAFVDQNVAS
jgi:xanthine dehydrogenase accessory factor